MSDYPEYNGSKPTYLGEVIEMPDGIDMKTLWDVQNCELRILDELERICNKHGINYSLTGGTLIGAARHNDFVPWDDDIDVDVYYKDLEKLKKILPEELGPEFEFVNYDEYGKYFCDFIPRIFYKNSETINSFSLNRSEENMCRDPRMNHIFIELYSIHDTKKGPVLALQIFVTKTIYGLCMGHRAQKKSNKKYSKQEKVFSSVLGAVGKFIPLKLLYFVYEKNAALVPAEKGDALFKPCVPLPVQWMNVFEKSWFESYTYLNVRGKKIMVPGSYDEMLTTLYGNWRQLPPVKGRHPDHFDLAHVKIW